MSEDEIIGKHYFPTCVTVSAPDEESTTVGGRNAHLYYFKTVCADES